MNAARSGAEPPAFDAVIDAIATLEADLNAQGRQP